MVGYDCTQLVWVVKSVFSSLQPRTPTPGEDSRQECIRLIAGPRSSVSGLRNSKFLPVADLKPRLLARAKPRFCGLRISLTPGRCSRTRQESSVEALSTMIISYSSPFV